jgi:peptidoglycan/LPS O-acetylase OafA/YrhL
MDSPSHGRHGDRPAGTHRLIELDALRGLAALSVLFYHYTSIYPRLVAGRSLEFVPQIHIGYFGIEVFFMISGFVIFYTVSKAPSALDFVMSRVSRLYPPYWAAVVLAALIHLLNLGLDHGLLVRAVLNTTMVQTFLGARHLDEVYWTLSYELSFYVLISVVAQIGRRTKLQVEWLLLAWLLGATLVRGAGIEVPYRLSVFSLLHYGQFFITGMALFLIQTRGQKPITWLVLAWSVALSGFGADAHTPAAGFRYYFETVFACTLLFAAVVLARPRICRAPVLLFLGRISYSLYLVHAELGYFLLRRFEQLGFSDPAAIVMTTALAIAAGHALNRLVEVPGQRWMHAALLRARGRLVGASRPA